MSTDVKTNAMRILDKLGVPYECNFYKCDNFVDGVSVADMLGQSYDSSFKTLVTVGKSGEYFVFVIPIDKELDLKKAAKLAGEKSVEMVAVKNILSVTGYIRGGCTPIGMKKRFPTYIHSTALNFPFIYISAGVRGLQIKIAPNDLIAFVCAEVGELSVEMEKE